MGVPEIPALFLDGDTYDEGMFNNRQMPAES